MADTRGSQAEQAEQTEPGAPAATPEMPVSPPVVRQDLVPQVPVSPPTVKRDPVPQVPVSPPTVKRDPVPQVPVSPPTVKRDPVPAVPVSPPTVKRDPVPAVPVSPPTVKRDAAGRAPAVTPTVRDSGPGSPSGGRPGAAGGGYYPDELRAEYEPVEICGEGSEATVWRANRVADGREVAVKVHRPGMPFDTGLIRHLDNPGFRQHVPELHGYGEIGTPYGRIGWVAMEFLPTTLAGLMFGERQPGGGVGPARAEELVAELARTLHFWQDPHGLDRTPIDVKPDNFGVRRARPAELVVLDFGGVVRQTVTQRHGDVTAAQAYMSPEGVLGERNQASPWWSLGVIAFELATGRTRFRRPDGSLLPDDVVRRDIMLGEVDLSDVPGQRWLLLLSGLFTRDPADRWGWSQVSSWLDGGSPEVVRPAAVAPAPAARPLAHEPITFQGRAYYDPAVLAAAMLTDSPAAARWLASDAAQLRRWLREEVADNRFDTGYLVTIAAGATERADLAVLAFGAVYAREGIPRYRGTRIDPEGLLQICATGEKGEADLRGLLDSGALAIAAGYACQHPGCQADGRCAVLDRAAREVPEILTGVEQTAGELLPAGPRRLSAAERGRAVTAAFGITLRPGQLRFPRLSGSGVPAWWRTLTTRAASDPSGVAGRTALIAATVLYPRAVQEQREQAAERAQRNRMRYADIRPRAITAALAALAMMLLAWSAAVAGAALSRHDKTLLSTKPSQLVIGAELARVAAVDASRLLPLVVVLAVATAVPRIGRWVLLWGAVAVAALGLFSARVPAFSVVPAPGFVTSWLASGGHAVSHWIGFAAVLAVPAVAVVCIIVAAARLTTLESSRVRGARPSLARLPAGARHVAVGLTVLVILQATLWAAVVISMTLSGPRLPGVVIGAAAARYLSGLLPACAVLAVLAAVLRPAGARLVAWAGVAAVAVAGAFLATSTVVMKIWHPVASVQLAHLASFWGGGAFWAAVFVAVPLAIAGLSVLP